MIENTSSYRDLIEARVCVAWEGLCGDTGESGDSGRTITVLPPAVAGKRNSKE